MMTIQISDELERALEEKARAVGVPVEIYALQTLKRDLAESPQNVPLKTGYGMWAKYGVSLSAEEIDENRKDMFQNFGETF
jgi:hypothetical protein